MIKRFFLIFLLAMVGGLTACGPLYETVYSYTPPRSAEGRMCINQCQQIKSYCAQNCKLEERSCKAQAKEDAYDDYDDYVRERRRDNAPLKKTLSSFDRSSQCSSDTSCANTCGTDFNFCYSSCGGQVTSQRVCTAFCK